MVDDLLTWLHPGMGTGQVRSMLGGPSMVLTRGAGEDWRWVIGHGESDCYYLDLVIRGGWVMAIGKPAL